MHLLLGALAEEISSRGRCPQPLSGRVLVSEPQAPNKHPPKYSGAYYLADGCLLGCLLRFQRYRMFFFKEKGNKHPSKHPSPR